MAIHGVADMRFTATTPANNIQEAYTALFRFLTSSYAQSIGIQRIAYNNGASATGPNFWNESNANKDNAFSVYRFMSASNPFYMLMQYTAAGANFGTSPGNPAVADALANTTVLAFAFASRLDGSSPWAGTTNNNGSDTKGATVWTAGGSSLFVWPRSNNTGGTHATNKQNMSFLIQAAPVYGSRMNFIADENNVLFAFDDGYTSGNRLLFFGKYNPRSGLSPVMPYVCLRNNANTNDPIFTLGTYGTTAGSANTNDGGLPHPVSSSVGTLQLQASGINEFWTAAYQPNLVFGTSSAYFDEHPIHIGISEAPHFGYVGQIDWIKYTYAQPSYAVSSDLSRVVFGSGLVNTTKITAPWSGSAPIPGSTFTREGTFF